MQAAYSSYITRSGIFFSMFLSALCPSFMDYHLVTVTAMLMPLLMVATVFYACSCLFVLGQGVESANATETKESINPALKQINNAFEKQLDALYADDALDISTDVTVLEAMLKRDNLN